ncbi:hypothetical protein Y032_0608g595 [Ancylostoma ceylanicum]|nr:hypothetical protein Y032_0608g595 [Ancylostoma ceylanicum]
MISLLRMCGENSLLLQCDRTARAPVIIFEDRPSTPSYLSGPAADPSLSGRTSRAPLIILTDQPRIHPYPSGPAELPKLWAEQL